MPDAKYCNVCVVAPLPPMGGHDIAVARLLARTILDGTTDYTKRQIIGFTSANGMSLQCTVMPDHIRLQLGFLRGDLSQGLSIVKSIIEDATFSDETVAKALDVLPLAHPGYWGQALMPETPEYKPFYKHELLELYHQAFRPDKISVAVSGPFSPGQARDRWTSLYADWRARSWPNYLPGVSSRLDTHAGRSVTTFELSGPEFSGTDPRLPARLLAAVALGCGKESSVYRLLREKLLISYRQEAMLWPTSSGFRMRVIAALKPRQDEAGLPDTARQALLDDVATWNAASRERAVAMAEGVFLRGLPLSPLQLQTSGPTRATQDDRTFLTAYWPLKTGSYWSESAILKALRAVSLDDMKVAASEALTDSKSFVISGL